MRLRSILVVSDLSAQESMAMQRAAQLAGAHGADLQRVPWSRVDKLEDLAAEAKDMDLVVLPHRRDLSIAAFFRGQTVARLLRLGACPVLVVRQPHGPRYRRALVAVDFSPASAGLVEHAMRLDRGTELEILHAVSTVEEARLRSAEATEQAVRAYSAQRLRRAETWMLALTAAFDTRARRLAGTIVRGAPGRQIVQRQEHAGADLVVVGRTIKTAWQDFFRGSVSHHVLAWGSSDVLVVPQPRALAASRLRAAGTLQRNERPALGMGGTEGGWP